MSENEASEKRQLSYAEKRGGGTRAVQEARRRDEEKKAEQAAIAARMGSRNPPLGERLKASRQSEQLAVANKRAAHEVEQARVAAVLEERIELIQQATPMPYRERLEVITLAENNPSSKDLRTPTERRRDELAHQRRVAASSQNDQFYE